RLDEESYTKESEITVKEIQPMATKRKSDMLADVLANLLRDSADIVGAGVVGTDGLVYSANVPFKDMEEDMVGAAAAAAFGLSKRSAAQLKRGNFTRTLIQGDEGNVIIVNLNPETLLVALTPDAVNLGMAFAEVRDAASQLQDIL
ncbi:MAG: roadblock/LC7 domain-containing protein, partial [Anaerolineae bacterium]